LILILILLFIGLMVKLFKTKKATSKAQTKLYIYFESASFVLKKHLLDLVYSSDYYKIEIQNRMIQFKHFGFIGYIQLNECIKIVNKLTKLNVFVLDTIYVFPFELKATSRMFANQFHPLVIIADRKGKHQDVFHLTNMLTGTEIQGGQLYSLAALAAINSSIP